MSVQELRPLSVGEIMSAALRIYLTRFGTLFRLVAVFVLPVEIIYAVLFTSSSGKTNSTGGFVSGMLLVLTGQLASAACLKAVSDTYLGHPTSWRASFDFVWKRLGPVIGVALLGVLLVAVGFILLVIPGVYLDVALLVATPALLIEGLSPVRALARSRELVRGTWWRTLGAYLLAAIFVGIVALVPTLIFLHAAGANGQTTNAHPLASQIISVVASMFTTPFMASVVALIYYDLRVRKEGLLLEDLARGVGIDPGAIPPGRFDGPEEPPYPDRYP